MVFWQRSSKKMQTESTHMISVSYEAWQNGVIPRPPRACNKVACLCTFRFWDTDHICVRCVMCSVWCVCVCVFGGSVDGSLYEPLWKMSAWWSVLAMYIVRTFVRNSSTIRSCLCDICFRERAYAHSRQGVGKPQENVWSKIQNWLQIRKWEPVQYTSLDTSSSCIPIRTRTLNPWSCFWNW